MRSSHGWACLLFCRLVPHPGTLASETRGSLPGAAFFLAQLPGIWPSRVPFCVSGSEGLPPEQFPLLGQAVRAKATACCSSCPTGWSWSRAAPRPPRFATAVQGRDLGVCRFGAHPKVSFQMDLFLPSGQGVAADFKPKVFRFLVIRIPMLQCCGPLRTTIWHSMLG